MNTPKPLLVFDFDGTLIDSLGSIVAAINGVLTKVGLQKISPDDLEQFRLRGADSFLAKIGVTKLLLPFVVKAVQKRVLTQGEKVKPVPSLGSVLKTLKRHGYSMGIVSSNSVENVNHILTELGWLHLFEFVMSGGVFDKDKVLESLLHEKKLSTDQMIYIGDESRDVEAGQKTGVRVIAVSWGFQAKSALVEKNPDWLVDTPNQLLRLFVVPWWKKLFMIRWIYDR